MSNLCIQFIIFNSRNVLVAVKTSVISTRNTIAAHADKDSAMIVLRSGYPFRNEAGEKIQ